MSHVIVLASAKGGVGKTTGALALIAAAAARGMRIVAFDLDPMASLTAALGAEGAHSLASVLIDGVPMEEALVDCAFGAPHVRAVPGCHDLEHVHVDPDAFRDVVSVARERADVLVVDTPPRASFLAAPMRSADVIVVPTDMSDQGLNVARTTVTEALRLGVLDRVGGLLLGQVRPGTVVTEISGRRVQTLFQRNIVDNLEALEICYRTVLSDSNAWKLAYAARAFPPPAQMAVAMQLLDEVLTKPPADPIALECFAESSIALSHDAGECEAGELVRYEVQRT